MSIKNSAFLTVLDKVHPDDIADLEKQMGAVIYDEVNEIVLYCDGEQWVDLTPEVPQKTAVSSASCTGGLPQISLGDTYEPILISNSILFQSDTDSIEVAYNQSTGFEETTFKRSGIVYFSSVFYIAGPTQREIYLKAYRNGSEISPGDVAGTNLDGNNNPSTFVFTGFLPVTQGDVITFFGRMDTSTADITITGGNYFWEFTDITL